MLKKSVVEHTLEAALETGADFAELYVEQTKRNHIAMVNGQVETALGGLDYGAGIRLFCGNRVIYAFVNDTSEENLVRTAREMASTVKGTHLLRLPDWKTRQWQNINPIFVLPDDVEKRKKANYLAADKANDGLEINRINSDIVIQKGNINEYQRELGMYYWARFVMGDQLDEEATAICDKIVKAQDRIKELEAEIEQVKADREAEKAERAEQKRLEAEAAAQEAAERAAQKAAEAAGDVQITDADGEVGRFCGGCGAPLAEGQKFCGSCGKPADDVK